MHRLALEIVRLTAAIICLSVMPLGRLRSSHPIFFTTTSNRTVGGPKDLFMAKPSHKTIKHSVMASTHTA